MWRAPSTSATLARWLRSAMSSAISGWSVSSSATSLTWTCDGAVTSTHMSISGSARQAATSSRLGDDPGAGRRPARRPGSAASRRQGRGVGVVVAGSIGLRCSARGRLAARPRRAYAAAGPAGATAGSPTAVTTAATRKIPTMIRAASPAAHRSSASTTSPSRSGRSRRDSGDELQVGVRRRVDLVVQAVDGRGAVGGQDREADGHADHAGDRHRGRGGAVRLARPPPRRRPWSGA